MTEDMYSAEVMCDNCGKHKTVLIPKGITINFYVINKESEIGKCDYCGCRGWLR